LINLDISTGDIELEDLPGDYDFPFQDFPRTDGTPCLIYNEDALLERERQRQAKEIFASSNSMDDADYSSGTEKKEDDTIERRRRGSSVSDLAFRRMLSENSMALDDSCLDENDDDDAMAVINTEGGSSLWKTPQFQQQLARLLETKQRRYAMEYKKEVIVQEQRKKRKHIREKQRVERHKAMERDLEEIEAEFFLSPSSLGRTKNPPQQKANPPLSLSPTGSSGHCNSNDAMDSPFRKGTTGMKTTASPGPRLSARSPIHRLGASVRKKQNSLGSSLFRRLLGNQHTTTAPSPRIAASGSGTDIFPTASHDWSSNSHHRSVLSKDGGFDGFDVLAFQEHTSKFPQINKHDSDMFDQHQRQPWRKCCGGFVSTDHVIGSTRTTTTTTAPSPAIFHG
jgi:hypothetical protein